MNEKLYDMMDWGKIEGLVYSDEDNPHDFLGAHVTEEGVLIQAFIPTAVSMDVFISGTGQKYPMEKEDETGFFAVLVPGNKIPDYRFSVLFDNGTIEELQDPYNFKPQITEEKTKKFNSGTDYEAYKMLGSHTMTVNGVKGTYFAVWAPNAVRVSLVGDFNLWDGRRNPMRRLWDSGIFEIFMPDLGEGTIYKYEIKAKSGLTFLKADPYANEAELRPHTASIVTDLDGFNWTDEKWISTREAADLKQEPMAIYEVHLGTWKKPEDGREFYNYREMAPLLAEYVKKMGYTHVELMPIMEHPQDESWGYQTTGYFAPTSRYGNPKDFMFFMNYMHTHNIGVILDWVPEDFPKDVHGLCGFDGTCLYEHKDPRQGTHPRWGTLLYNYGRPEVRNFLIASALFWAKEYHADGIRMDAVESMLYLDYGKNEGEWVANIYGGNENLDAIDFLKKLNTVFKEQCGNAMLIAEEHTAYPKVTAPVSKDGLGFDYKWNNGWESDFLSYMQLDPIFRGYHHGDLIFSMIYNYSENFILPFPHRAVDHGKGSLITKFPGNQEKKFANLRAALGYLMVHPGKKLIFMGQDFGQSAEWNGTESVDWAELKEESHRQTQDMFCELLKVYNSCPALYRQDYAADGFEWINNISANENILVFLRKTEKPEENLLIVCNFSSLVYEDRKIGVPFHGKYKEIFNSDNIAFGGAGHVNARMKSSRVDECDARENSIRITVPPMGICIFTCTPVEARVSANIRAKAEKDKTEKIKAAREKARAGLTEKAAKPRTSLKEELEQKYREAEEERDKPIAAQPVNKTTTAESEKPAPAEESVKPATAESEKPAPAKESVKPAAAESEKPAPAEESVKPAAAESEKTAAPAGKRVKPAARKSGPASAAKKSAGQGRTQTKRKLQEK